MSEPYVSVLEPETDELRAAMEKLDLAPVAEVMKKAADELYQHILDTAQDYFTSNLSEAIDGAARSLASRYLGEALAGDDERLKRLFGLWYDSTPRDWSLIEGHFPDSWTLLRALCEKFPDLLQTAALVQYEHEVKALRAEVARLYKQNDELRRRL